MLLLADRGFFSFTLWRKASATGADLLRRIRTDAQGPPATRVQDLPAGFWLAHLKKSTDHTNTPPMLVRFTRSTTDGTTPRATGCSRRCWTPRRFRHRARCGLPLAVGDRAHLRRAQDPPARTPPGAAVQVPRPGPAGDLGPLVLPLRDPHPDGRRRPTQRTRPDALRRRPAHRTPVHRPQGRFPPLRHPRQTGFGSTPSLGSCTGSTRPGDCAPHRAPSNARCTSGTSNAATTPTGPTHIPRSTATERYWDWPRFSPPGEPQDRREAARDRRFLDLGQHRLKMPARAAKPDRVGRDDSRRLRTSRAMDCPSARSVGGGLTVSPNSWPLFDQRLDWRPLPRDGRFTGSSNGGSSPQRSVARRWHRVQANRTRRSWLLRFRKP